MSKQSMKVGTRLALGFGLVLALMAGISGLGIYNMQRIHAQLEKVVQLNVAKLPHVQDMSEAVHVVARGWGALPATFAALLGTGVVQVTLKNALTSYSDIAETEDYAWPLSALLPDVLRKFDLPDCYRALAAKNLRQIEPWDAKAGMKT